ncbi:MAG: hypothetical protein IJS28_07795 [Synergistaceae bacterium]|nr:hypothetical protein [Synergistaceae bacterium]
MNELGMIVNLRKPEAVNMARRLLQCRQIIPANFFCLIEIFRHEKSMQQSGQRISSYHIMEHTT